MRALTGLSLADALSLLFPVFYGLGEAAPCCRPCRARLPKTVGRLAAVFPNCWCGDEPCRKNC